jgi:threonine dehydratase
MTVSRTDIESAAQRIHGHVRRTPSMSLEPGALRAGDRVSLKLELFQHAGSFKPRGAFNRILSADVPAAGVIAASGGNFGIAVAYAARELGHPAEVFVPETSPAAKIERLGRLGATVRLIPGYYADALAACEERARSSGALFMHAYDQPEIVAGAGTVGRELAEEVPSATTVLVAVGGGGLIGGIASWFRGDVRVVAVEPERCPTLTAALAAGEPVDVEVGGVAADSLGARRIGCIALEAASSFVEGVVLLQDEAIVDAQRRLWSDLRLVAEPGGAAAVAALTSGRYVSEPGEHVVALVCGANADPASVA